MNGVADLPQGDWRYSIEPRIDVWGSIHPESRGYLDYIDEFVKKAGAAVQAY